MTDPNPTVRMPIPDDPGVPPPAAEAALPPAAAAAPPPQAPAPAAVRSRSGGIRLGSVVLGLIVLGLGVWFFADQTLGMDMPDISWRDAWPVILIAAGAWIVVGALRERRS